MMLLSDQKQSSVKEPAQDVALLKQAVAAYRLGDKDRSRELLNTAAELNPDNPLIWLWRASVAASYKEAVSSLERVLALDPENAKARQWMEKLQRARTEALRKAGIEVPEASNGARPTLVKPEPAPVVETRPEAQPESEPEASSEPPAESPSLETREQAEAERDPLLDLLAERDEQSSEADQEPSAQSQPATYDEALSESQSPDSQPGDTQSGDILGELLAGRTEDAPPAAETVSEQEQSAPETTPANGLPAPVQPAPVQQAQTEDSFSWLHETGVAPKAEAPAQASAPVSDPVKDLTPFLPTPAGPEQPATDEPESDLPAESPVQESAPTLDEPARSKPLVATEQLACPICEQMWTEPQRLCPGCGALTDLSLVDEAPRHDGADRAALRAAAKRLEAELEAAPTAEAHRSLGLVYMNLRQSNDALVHLRETTRLDPSDQEARAAVVALEKRRLILAVDDSKTIQRMIASVLEKESYRVALAADGLQALARLDDEMPAVMLLDITMPRMDGYQVCKVVTGNDATKHIPVIMLSGKDGFFDKVRGKMVGASNYITKPFDPTALLKAISKQMPN